MARMIKYLCCVFFCFCFCSAPAQDTGTYTMPTEVEEELYTEEGTVAAGEQNEFGSFDSVVNIREREVDQEQLNEVRKDEDYWYANMEPEPKKKKAKKKEVVFESNDWLDTIFWILLVGGFVALVIWLLATSRISLFRKPSRKLDEAEEELNENIFELDFAKEIHAAVATKNYRLGVRLLYLQTLRQMADGGIIEYTAEKTNSDYLLQLSGSKHYKSFSRLTRIFDYIWYGKFPVAEDEFRALQKDFLDYKQSLV